MTPKPLLLAPAGGQAQLEAALHAGADAVYFGLQSGFNARARATGFAADSLPAVMAQLHRHGCAGYLTLNTLVFDQELPALEQAIRAAATAGVDALIVQDIGAAQLARAVAPALPLHGSTQMSITDADGVAFAAALGVRRVVLGRELALDEIAQIIAATSLEVEVFVHGALCVSYSGQCFSSEAWGGRSANRGQCAQACRLPYGLLVDGERREQGDMNYLLSPQDLMALPWLPQLIEAGAHCLKIEGRLKGPEYVHRTVSAYRAALDRAWAAQDTATPLADTAPTLAQRRRLAQVFSRGQDAHADGLTPGFLLGPRHQELVIGRNPRHRGLLLGQISTVDRRGVTLELANPVKAGDGVVFDQGNPQARELGGNVYAVVRCGQPVRGEVDAGEVTLTFAADLPLHRLQPGDRVWRSKDAAMDAGPRLARAADHGRVPTRITVELRLGQPLRLTLEAAGHQLRHTAGVQVERARRQALDRAAVAQAIGTLGDTSLALAELTVLLDPDVFVPLSQLKAARREALTQLKHRLQHHQQDHDMPAAPVLPGLLPPPAAAVPTVTPRPTLTLLCRSREQVDAALTLDGIDAVIVDFLEVHGLKAACQAVRAAGRTLAVAAPRIFKPGEERLVRYLLGLAPDALLVRSTGLLWRLTADGAAAPATRPALWGDFSLNASNVLSARHLLRCGLERLALTHDVDAAQITALATALPAAERQQLELIAHHHLPIFHTEHCVFARFLSHGNSYVDCGRPCEAHQVHLRDPVGKDHLLLADVGCRNTVFNAQAQSALPYAATLRTAGLGHWRVELVDEPADQVATLVTGYRALLDGTANTDALWRTLGTIRDANHRRQGVGTGSLTVRLEAGPARLKTPSAR